VLCQLRWPHFYLSLQTGRAKLPEHHRRAKATTAANKYAPRPEGSSITYGLIAVVLAVLALIIFGMFYGLDVLAHPILLGLGSCVIFALGVLLRRRRRRRHGQAFDHEFSKHDNLPPRE
jgi:protein-S-isoprenylcysteine O-methyltransferase Ste14